MSKILITGGAGFIGCNAADMFANEGWQVTVLDNLSRRGTELNLKWLRQKHLVDFLKVDIRDASSTAGAIQKASPDVVLHLAAQVAVTTSVTNPREDFEINAFGTLNVLEGIRAAKIKPLVIYSSTNKVYGGMEEVVIEERRGRYEYRDLSNGTPETMNLDFHSPYGCSKGTADQYIHDYGRIYGIPSVVMRQSCIYGQRQFGIEDQGWVAWFIIAASLGHKITIYGDGKQVRDVLHVNDLVQAYLAAVRQRDRSVGQIFNIGGGSTFTMSLIELMGDLKKLLGKDIPTESGDWRPGDQRVYVSDIRRAEQVLGWKPRISPKEGVRKLYSWVQENRQAIAQLLGY